MTLHHPAFLTACLLAAACSNSPTPTPATGGPVEGAADNHCAGDGGLLITTPTSQASCHAMTEHDHEEEETPPTRYGTASYDDDCKYYVSFTVDPVQKGKNASFVVTATDLTTGAPVKGAHVMAETVLGSTHGGPAPTSTEMPDGTYRIDPFAFDESGRWTVRFHFFDDCNDLVEDSPHSHVAFFIDVP